MDDVRALIESSVEIDAGRDAVWAVVGDPSRMPEWSPMVAGVRWVGDGPHPRVGSRFSNKNTLGELVWLTHAEITDLEPATRLVFRVEENWAVWSFHLADAPSGRTLLTQRRETPEGITDLSKELTDGFMGGQDAFQTQLLASMDATLESIRDAVQGA